MARPASSIGESVRARTKGLEQYVTRVERLSSDKHLSAVDVRRAYAGAFLSHYSFIESSIERLFLGALRGRVTFAERTVRPLIEVKSDAVARAIVRAGQRYIDWIPFELTKRRAEAFFSVSAPFPEISGQDYKVLERARLIRNAIAHESSDAISTFKNHFVVGLGLPPHQQTPPGYLRGRHTQGQTRFVFLINESLHVFQQLCA